MPEDDALKETGCREYLLDIPLWTRKKNTLAQVRDFLTELGDPERELKLIHVAGTNGKGSVCADLTAVLVEAGYHVGTFVSPHLVDVKERFLLDGEPIPEELFAESFAQVLAVVRRMTARGYCHPTFFEFVFLMALVCYRKARPDYVILETGLGGRLDTTNVIRSPLACVITSISLDHTQYLGETIPEIAAEKAGIIKPSVPVIYDDNRPEASAVIAARARALSAPGYPVREDAVPAPGDPMRENAAPTPAGADALCGSVVPEFIRQLPFAAPYQAMNAALAVRALSVLGVPGVDEEVCRRALSKVRWAGRMEQVGPDLWLDGAHNPGGIAAFVRAVKRQTETLPEPRQIHLLFAAVADKDYGAMIRTLCTELPLARVTVVQLGSSRAADAGMLAEQFASCGCTHAEAFADAREALAAALRHKGSGDRLYIVGSLYLVGEIKAILEDRRDQDAGF